MATPWPQVAAWPNDVHEHTTYLSDYLRKALACIDSAQDQPIPKPLVKTMIAAMSVLITKFQNAPDVGAVMQTLATMQNDLRTTAETVQSTAMTVPQTAVTHQQVARMSRETNQAVKEAAEMRRSTTVLLQETNDIAKATNDIAKAIGSTPASKAPYASVLSSNAAPLSKPITLSTQTSSFIQAQREIIVKIADPSTIESLRAKSHVDGAFE